MQTQLGTRTLSTRPSGRFCRENGTVSPAQGMGYLTDALKYIQEQLTRQNKNGSLGEYGFSPKPDLAKGSGNSLGGKPLDEAQIKDGGTQSCCSTPCSVWVMRGGEAAPPSGADCSPTQMHASLEGGDTPLKHCKQLKLESGTISPNMGSAENKCKGPHAIWGWLFQDSNPSTPRFLLRYWDCSASSSRKAGFLEA